MVEQLLLRVLRWIDTHVFRAWRCSVCGCTDHFACVDGCGWCSAAPDRICTTCALADPALVMVEREHRIAKLERRRTGAGMTTTGGGS